MPITPAHAAAAWPLRRVFDRLPTSALVIGTTAPDLLYVLRMEPRGRFGHSAPGVFLLCLPATLLLWWAWRAAIRPSLTPLLPPRMRAAAEAPGPEPADLPLAVVAALVGALSHIVWDGFTHSTGLFVEIFPVLNAPVPGNPQLGWFAVLQFVSSVAGMVMVLAWMAGEWRRWPSEARRFAPGQAAQAARAVMFLVAVSLGVAAVNATFADTWVDRAGRAAVGAMAGGALALAIYAAWTGTRSRVSVGSG